MHSNERKIIYVDTETTGLKQHDRLCQLAFLVETIDKKENIDKKMYETFCNPNVQMSAEAFAVNQISDEMLKNKPSLLDTDEYRLLSELNRPENILVAQNAPFDLGMLSKEGFEWKGQVIDTVSCTRKLCNEDHRVSATSLQFLREVFDLFEAEEELASTLNVEVKAHDAVGDVVSLYALTQYLKSSKYFKDLVGMTKEEALAQLSDKKDFLMRYIRFGKHNGKTFAEVLKEVPEYIDWVIKCDWMEPSIVYSAQALQSKQ